jgi:hypothetical protein
MAPDTPVDLGHLLVITASSVLSETVRPGGPRRGVNSRRCRGQARNVLIAAHRRDDGWITIGVDDDGRGIAPEERRAVFERFIAAKAPRRAVRAWVLRWPRRTPPLVMMRLGDDGTARR